MNWHPESLPHVVLAMWSSLPSLPPPRPAYGGSGGPLVRQALFIAPMCVAMLAQAGAPVRRPDPRPSVEVAGMLLQQAWYLEEGLRDLEGAIKLYDQVIREHPNETSVVVQALLRQAACYERLEQRANAWESYRKAYDFPDEVEKLQAYYRPDIRSARMLDDAFSGAGQDQLDSLTALLEKMSPGDIYRHYSKFRGEGFRLRNSDPVKAIETLKKAIELGFYARRTDDSAYLQSLIGDIYLDINQPDQAIEAYHRVHERFAGERELAAWSLIRIAEVYRQIGRLRDAIEVYSELPAAYPDQKSPCAWAWLWMGDCFRELDDMASAYAKWDVVLDIPEADDTRLQRRVARWLIGKEPLPDTLEIKGAWANDVFYFVGVQREMMGMHAGARNAFRRSLSLSDERDWPAPITKRLVDFYGEIE